MIRWLIVVFFAFALLKGGILYPTKSNAEVNVNITIPLPEHVITAPPAMVVIPGTYAYFAPAVGADIFFYHGYWYRPYEGRWYISAVYNEPWEYIAINRVPSVLINLPPSYRHVPRGYNPIPYGMVKRNWRTWENERYWDNYERRRRGDYDGDGHAMSHGGHGMGHGTGMGRRGDDD